MPAPCSYLQRRRDRQGAYFTWEVIIVDDGSKDGTVRAAADFVRKHGFDAVRVLRLPRNRGKGYAGACTLGRQLCWFACGGPSRAGPRRGKQSRRCAIGGLSLGLERPHTRRRACR